LREGVLTNIRRILPTQGLHQHETTPKTDLPFSAPANGSIHYEIKWLWVNTTRALMAHQRDCVKRIVISYPSLDYGPGIASLERVSSRLPALDEVEILFHDIAKPSFDGSDFQSKKEATTERLTRGVEELGFSFKVKVSGTKETMESFWADI
jgi:hypothetical protein